MLLIKNDKIKRAACFLLSLLLVFCILLSPICEARAYAMTGTVVVVGFGALLVIGSIIVGLGIEVVDPGSFDKLCNQVLEKLNEVAVVRDEIFLKVQNGVQYVENQLVLQIAKILYELKSFTDVPSTKTVDYLGRTLKVFEMSEDKALKTPVSYFGTAFNYDITSYLTGKPEVFKIDDVFSITITSRVWTETPLDYFSGYDFFINGDLYCGSNGGVIWGDIGFPIILNYYLVIPITFKNMRTGECLTGMGKHRTSPMVDISSGSICPDYKVGEKTPSISVDGSVSMPIDTPWSKNPAIPVSGVLSIPLSVPGDLGALKDKTQDDIMTGSTTDIPSDVVIDKEIDKALEDMKTPPQLIEKFPFSIPFDVVRAIQSLAAPPVAPTFTIPFKVPEYGIDWEFKMDWSKFTIPIAIVKWGTFLIFLLYLAVGTKKLIWG